MVKWQRTWWGPDTCNCEIFYTWDSDLPLEQRVHTGVDIGKDTVLTHPEGTIRCDAHKKHNDPHKHYLTVNEESVRKQNVYGILLDHLVSTGQHEGVLKQRIDDSSDTPWWTIHPSHIFHVVFEDDEDERDESSPRAMKVDVLGAIDGKSVLKKEIKSALQKRIDKEIPAIQHQLPRGRVTIILP